MGSSVTLDMLKDKLLKVSSYEGYVAAVCPFHEDSRPSMLIWEDGKFFKCQSCGVSGSFEKLWRKLLGWDSSRVVAEATNFKGPRLPSDLAQLSVVINEAHESLLQFDQFQWYLKNRGVEGRIEACRIGFWDGWYSIPIYDEEHHLQGAMFRANATIQKGTGQRFIHPDGQLNLMYCPDWRLLRTAKAVAVVFGMFDALALSDLRFAVVTSTSGKDSFKPEWLDSVRKPIYVIPDKGEETSAITLAGKLGWRGHVLKLEYPDDIKDPDGYLENNKRDQLIAQIGGYLS
jgi:hypothetical protein